MSSTNRGGQRSEADNYPTPAWCVHRLLEACPLPGGRWLEPAAGEGAIIRAVGELRLDALWTAVEVRDTFQSLREVVDQGIFAETDFLGWKTGDHFDVVLTNPPYSLAEAFIRKAKGLADVVVMLLRLNFLGSKSRAAWLRESPPDVYVLPNRPSFVGGKTDSCEYAWFVWRPVERRSAGSIRVLAPTPREARRG